jgi:two-component system, sensor histidine kinase and response regulator
MNTQNLLKPLTRSTMAEQTIKVLLIEANPADAQLVGEMLTNTRATGMASSVFEVVHVDQLSAGLAQLRDPQARIDVVLLDLWLPDSRGLDTLTTMRDLTLSVPTLVLTDREDESLALKALQQGAQDCLVKRHLNSNMLARVLSYTIERHRLTAKLNQFTHALQASEMRLRTIIDTNVDGIIITDEAGVIRFANTAAESLYGRPADQLLGEMCGLPLRPGDTTECEIGPGGEGGAPVVEIRVVDIDWQEETAYLASLRDITERKQVEKAEKELLQMKDDFIASVSHQLRTPLFSIKGFLELLLKNKVQDPAIQQEFLTRAAHDADRLLTLVNELLDISRLESGHLDLALEAVDLKALIAETLQALQGLAADKGIALSFWLPDPPLIVRADRHWLQQVVINFVGNAIKFSENHRPVHVTGQMENGQVTIKVIDQGPGIPPEAVPRLFSKFYQANTSQKRAGRGSGLGLYISKKIVEAHGGRVGVESDLGWGSTFFCTLATLERPETQTEATFSGFRKSISST